MSPVSRSALILSLALGLVMAGVFTGNHDAADAQEPQAARLSVEASGDAASSTAVVSLDAGSSGIAALGGGLTYDAALLRAETCEISAAGACNIVDGEVLFAGFDAQGFRASEEFLTVEFTPLAPQAAAGVELELRVDTAAAASGRHVEDELLVESGEVAWAEAKGAVTGDILSGGEGLYGLEVCIAADAAPSCTTSSGLGSYRIDGLPSGTYTLVVTDPGAVYGSATISIEVVSPEISSINDIVLSPAGAPVVADEDAVDAADDDAPAEAPVADAPAADAPAAPAADAPAQDDDAVANSQAVDDGADDAATNGVSGQVLDAATGEPIFGLQVCATMPVILTQSCGFTTSSGTYSIDDLDTGNYEITAIDPAQRYQDAAGDRPVGITAEGGAIVDLAVERR